MRENTSNDINGGFYIIKNNKNIYQIINFFIEVLNILSNSNKKDIPYGDQTIINNLKSTINFDYIPNDYMIWGENIHNINKSLLHHCVCVGDIKGKLKQISQIYKKMKRYFLMKTH
jgi:hypothetical protein